MRNTQAFPRRPGAPKTRIVYADAYRRIRDTGDHYLVENRLTGLRLYYADPRDAFAAVQRMKSLP